MQAENRASVVAPVVYVLQSDRATGSRTGINTINTSSALFDKKSYVPNRPRKHMFGHLGSMAPLPGDSTFCVVSWLSYSNRVFDGERGRRRVTETEGDQRVRA